MTLISPAQAHFRTDDYRQFIAHLRPLLNRDVTIRRYKIEVITQDFSCSSPHLKTTIKTVDLTKEMTDPIPKSIDEFRSLLSREIEKIPPERAAVPENLRRLFETVQNPSTELPAFSAFCASIERAREDGGLRLMVQDCDESFSKPDQLSRQVTVEYGPQDGESSQATFFVER